MQNAETQAGRPALWFFDMDHTLIDNDCDVSWKKFLVQHGLAPAAAMDEADRFFADYLAGHLDYDAFIRFQLAEFASRTPAEMAALARWHFVEVVRPPAVSGGLPGGGRGLGHRCAGGTADRDQ